MPILQPTDREHRLQPPSESSSEIAWEVGTVQGSRGLTPTQSAGHLQPQFPHWYAGRYR